MGILYRVSQFWRGLTARAGSQEIKRTDMLLNPRQRQLFSQLQPAEKVHAMRMLSGLLRQDENQPDLLVAALLHDVGKLRYPLNPFERAMVVLVKAIKPEQARRWGSLPTNSGESVPRWRRAFVVAEHHAGWGAEMAHQAGVSALTETLIREHHHSPIQDTSSMENSLLHKLWIVDNES